MSPPRTPTRLLGVMRLSRPSCVNLLICVWRMTQGCPLTLTSLEGFHHGYTPLPPSKKHRARIAGGWLVLTLLPPTTCLKYFKHFCFILCPGFHNPSSDLPLAPTQGPTGSGAGTAEPSTVTLTHATLPKAPPWQGLCTPHRDRPVRLPLASWGRDPPENPESPALRECVPRKVLGVLSGVAKWKGGLGHKVGGPKVCPCFQMSEQGVTFTAMAGRSQRAAMGRVPRGSCRDRGCSSRPFHGPGPQDHPAFHARHLPAKPRPCSGSPHQSQAPQGMWEAPAPALSRCCTSVVLDRRRCEIP